jgi:hypothetical protein
MKKMTKLPGFLVLGAAMLLGTFAMASRSGYDCNRYNSTIQRENGSQRVQKMYTFCQSIEACANKCPPKGKDKSCEMNCIYE